jgi:hypothetical protein
MQSDIIHQTLLKCIYMRTHMAISLVFEGAEHTGRHVMNLDVLIVQQIGSNGNQGARTNIPLSVSAKLHTHQVSGCYFISDPEKNMNWCDAFLSLFTRTCG